MDKALFERFTHKVVEVDDVDDENLIEHFTDVLSSLRSKHR